MMHTVYQERRALGCRVQLMLVGADEPALLAIADSLWLDILHFEKRCSRFLPGSELSRFNRQAGSRLPVSPELAGVLEAARRMGHMTGGLYNPFILPSLQAAGYVASLEPAHRTDQVDVHIGKQLVAVDRLEVADGWAMIPYGTAIDLGGCGKGYLGDQLADRLVTCGEVGGFWVSLGGDTVLGGLDADARPWRVVLRPDPRSDDQVGHVAVPAGKRLAVATSTTRLRAGQAAGKRWHHIIDPRTAAPADTDIDLATVAADSLLVADVLASCVIIVGSAATPRLLRASDVGQAAWWTLPSGQATSTGDLITLDDALPKPIRLTV